MSAVTIDDHGRAFPIDVIHAAAGQRISLGRKIDRFGRNVRASGKPRLHRVLIARGHIDQMTGHERAQMGTDQIV
jgi:hypothetical protein